MKTFKKEEALNDKNRSIIGCLLDEISWEGSKITRYRDGGNGLENVLTTEVLQILYFLPRKHFLGEIIKNLHTKNESSVQKLLTEIEDSEFRLFPGNYYLIKDPVSHQKGISVQPDSLLITDSVYALIELKRIRRSSFQKYQLAREFYLTTRDAQDKIPLLILVTSKEPPVLVAGEGRVDPSVYIKKTLPEVYNKANSTNLPLDEIISLVDDHIAWITWKDILKIIEKQKSNYKNESKSELMSINRLCDALIDAINRHS